MPNYLTYERFLDKPISKPTSTVYNTLPKLLGSLRVY